jgi:hypothetical protein
MVGSSGAVKVVEPRRRAGQERRQRRHARRHARLGGNRRLLAAAGNSVRAQRAITDLVKRRRLHAFDRLMAR